MKQQLLTIIERHRDNLNRINQTLAKAYIDEPFIQPLRNVREYLHAEIQSSRSQLKSLIQSGQNSPLPARAHHA